MDTEEHIKIQQAIQNGHPETDEGPYYHESWWESYKGGVKGYLGGAIAYTGVGTAIGLATAAVLIFTGLAVATAALPIVAGFAAAGLLYGAHEFNDIGKIVGSNAAVAEKQEQRMKAFENGKFAEIKRELGELKAMISGKKAAAIAESPYAEASEDEAAHRTTHIGNHAGGSGSWIFWKVAAVGLITGLAAGALLAFGGTAEHLLRFMGAAEPLLKASTAAVITSMGLFGASFGINRDVFRRIFDKTDLWFKGIFARGEGRDRKPEQLVDKQGKSANTSIVTVVYPPDMADYPSSDTYHRERLAAAKLALLSMDPSKTMRQ